MALEYVVEHAEWALDVRRTVAAPRRLLFALWTEPEHLARWWGPRDFSTPFCGVDLRPGGTFRICARSRDGVDHWMRGVFRDIAAPERLVFTHAWEDDGRETLVTVTFAEEDGGTAMRFRQRPFVSRAQRDAYQEGWGECLDRFVAYATALLRAG